MNVYEIIDATNDEMYFPLAVFLSFDDALDAVRLSADPEREMTEGAEEFEEIQIFEREVGWSANGKKVYSMKRELIFDWEQDKERWKSTEEFANGTA